VVYPVGIPKNRTLDFQKSLITLLFLIQSLQNVDCKCALICSYCPPNLKKIGWSMRNFSKVYEKKIKKKNTKKLRRTLKVCIGVMAKWVQLKFGMVTRGTFQRKNCAVPFRNYRVIDAWKRHLLGSCIIHTCLLRARTGCTWPHNPLLCVSDS